LFISAVNFSVPPGYWVSVCSITGINDELHVRPQAELSYISGL